MEVYSLFEVNEYIRRILALNLPEAVWIKCEIAQCNESRGHHYLSLVQKEGEDIIARSEAVIWNRTYRKIRRSVGLSIRGLLQAGMEVKIKAKIDFNEKYGFKLLIEEIDPAHTLGQLELQKRATLQKLQEKELLGKNARLGLPVVLQRLAIISSENAAGLQDFLNQITSNSYGYYYDLKLFPAAMQGLQVVPDILKQVRKIKRSIIPYDAVVIIRGGGSRLDLTAFDQYELCEAMADFPLPVLTGIGHETDESLLDKVVHTPLKTPTAVAEFIINRNLNFESEIMQLGLLLQRQAGQLLQLQQLQLQQLEKQLQFDASRLLQQQQQQIDSFEQQIPQWSRFQVKSAQQQLQEWKNQLHIFSIEHTLQRGFSISLKEGKPIRSIDEVQSGDQIQIRLSDGDIQAEVD